MTKTKNNITELVFILDRSGSMSGLENDTIGGFNSLIEKQKKQDGKCFVSTVLFDHETDVIHDRLELKTLSRLPKTSISREAVLRFLTLSAVQFIISEISINTQGVRTFPSIQCLLL